MEGTLPNHVSSELNLLELSDATGPIGALNGPIPSALCRAARLRILIITNHQMEGVIPPFARPLSLLALYKNRFKVLADAPLENDASKTAILVHDNLLSCYLPWCGNATARTSLSAVGNRLLHPKDEFPSWVSKPEHDPLFWVSGHEGMSLVKKISGAVCFFMLVVALKLRCSKLLRALSEWQVGQVTHLWLVKASSHLVACMVKESLFRLIFLMLLLFWDLYACPQTLAMASACLRSSALIRTLVLLCWYNLSFHSPAVTHLLMGSEIDTKQWTAKRLRKMLLLWLLWCVLTVVLSTVAMLFQVSKSIPGFLQVRRNLSSVFQACIGVIHGLVGKVVPYLAGKVALATWQKHVFTTGSNLIMNCLIPVVVILYLDAACLGRWVTLWMPCRSNRQLFEHNAKFWNELGMHVYLRVLRSSDICDPHYSWSSTFLSRCMDVSLLRLQEIWLAKFVMTGLVMPGFTLMTGYLPKQSGKIVSFLATCAAYAIMSSGHLPLMMPVLLLALLGEGLVARVAWTEKGLKAAGVQSIAAPAVKMTRLLSLMVHLASAAGHLRIVAMTGACFVMADGIGIRNSRLGIIHSRPECAEIARFLRL